MSTDSSPSPPSGRRGDSYIGHETATCDPASTVEAAWHTEQQSAPSLSDVVRTPRKTDKTPKSKAVTYEAGEERRKGKKRQRTSSSSTDDCGTDNHSAVPDPTLTVPTPHVGTSHAPMAQQSATVAKPKLATLPDNATATPHAAPSPLRPAPTVLKNNHAVAKTKKESETTVQAASLLQRNVGVVTEAMTAARKTATTTSREATTNVPHMRSSREVAQHAATGITATIPEPTAETNRLYAKYIWKATQVFQTSLNAGYVIKFRTYLPANGAQSTGPPIVRLEAHPLNEEPRRPDAQERTLQSSIHAIKPTRALITDAPTQGAQQREHSSLRESSGSTRAPLVTATLSALPEEEVLIGTPMDVDPPKNMSWVVSEHHCEFKLPRI